MTIRSAAIPQITSCTNQPRGLFYTLARMIEVQRQRTALAALDVSQLQDLGLTEQEARQEAARSMWDLPES